MRYLEGSSYQFAVTQLDKEPGKVFLMIAPLKSCLPRVFLLTPDEAKFMARALSETAHDVRPTRPTTKRNGRQAELTI